MTWSRSDSEKWPSPADACLQPPHPHSNRGRSSATNSSRRSGRKVLRINEIRIKG